MATAKLPPQPEFFMHALQCCLPAGKAGAAKMKQITMLGLHHMKNCADSESKMYAEILKIIK